MVWIGERAQSRLLATNEYPIRSAGVLTQDTSNRQPSQLPRNATAPVVNIAWLRSSPTWPLLNGPVDGNSDGSDFR